MSSEVILIPRYYLPSGPVLIDGDIYKIFGFSNVATFRKRLKELVDEGKVEGVFRINNFEKYYLKHQNIDIPYMKTSSHTFVCKESYFLQNYDYFLFAFQ